MKKTSKQLIIFYYSMYNVLHWNPFTSQEYQTILKHILKIRNIIGFGIKLNTVYQMSPKLVKQKQFIFVKSARQIFHKTASSRESIVFVSGGWCWNWGNACTAEVLGRNQWRILFTIHLIDLYISDIFDWFELWFPILLEIHMNIFWS